MSRELKFRVWTPAYKKYHTLPEEFLGFKLNEDEKAMLAPVFECDVIEQYTGLKDKNGKEIYEGDIVRVGFWDGSYKVLYQVVWRRSDCRFIFENKSREESYPLKEDDSYEVIGNIHESNMEELCPKE